MNNKITPKDRSEVEIAGYRDVLYTIHNGYNAIRLVEGMPSGED